MDQQTVIQYLADPDETEEKVRHEMTGKIADYLVTVTSDPNYPFKWVLIKESDGPQFADLLETVGREYCEDFNATSGKEARLFARYEGLTDLGIKLTYQSREVGIDRTIKRMQKVLVLAYLEHGVEA